MKNLKYQFLILALIAGSHQAFAASVQPGRYSITAVHSGKCVDVTASGQTDGTNIQQYTCNGGLAQQFDVVQTATGEFKLISVVSGKAMDVAGGSTADGANVQQWTDNGNPWQRFFIPQVSGSTTDFNIISKNSNKCVDVAGGSTADGANVQQWTCNGNAQQRYRFNAVATSSTAARRQNMLNFFNSISGVRTIVGVENKSSTTPTGDTARVDAIAGHPSSFWGGDFGFGTTAVNNRNVMIGEAKNQYAKGAVPALMYHACSPTRDEYCSWDDIGGANPAKLTDAQFKDLLTPGTTLYNSWISRLDKLAVYFQDLKNNNVVVLFRPLHEMNQCVFWWACHKGPYGSPQLYQLTHDYLTKTKGLDNIIWVWNVQDFTTLSTDVDAYSPGTAYFDIASLDVYNTGYTTSNYNTMLRIANGKLIAIAENQFVPTPTLLSQQPKWLYEMLWPDFIDDPRNKTTLPQLYGAGNAETLDKMPGWH